MSLTLVIGNRNYSSWSLRAWLYMKHSGLTFVERRIVLDVDGFKERILEVSPAGCVPVLLDGDLRVWDSLAIMEHLRERFADQAIAWPDDAGARARARSISAEMHSGFGAIRSELPQNIRARTERERSDVCQRECQRVFGMWTDCRRRFGGGGPWLFGDFTIADAMYAPVALRFLTYGVDVPAGADEFMAAVTGCEHIKAWAAASADEEEHIALFD